jgi:hypothetical protein
MLGEVKRRTHCRVPVLEPGAQNQLAAHKKSLQEASTGKRKAEDAAPFETLPEDHKAWVMKHASMLGELPSELVPGTKHGQHSYTCSSSTGARVEVLLRNNAYFVKSAGQGAAAPVKKYRVRWDRNGSPQATWALLREEIKW